VLGIDWFYRRVCMRDLKNITYKYQSIGVRLDLTLNNNPEMKLHCSRIVRRRNKI
jgi:hypothetical protein